VQIHAYVLMNNHYHLLIRCLEPNLSEAIRWLQVSYASRFNWAHRRRGHVFQGRSKLVLLLKEGLLGRSWSDMTSRYGDWGRNGVMAVATRHLGWRLIEVVREIPGLSHGAAAQGIRQFWKHLAKHPEQEAFRKALLMQMLNIQI